jgi:hypothetical protein
LLFDHHPFEGAHQASQILLTMFILFYLKLCFCVHIVLVALDGAVKLQGLPWLQKYLFSDNKEAHQFVTSILRQEKMIGFWSNALVSAATWLFNMNGGLFALVLSLPLFLSGFFLSIRPKKVGCLPW